MILTNRQLKNFFSKIELYSPTGCWIWTGSTDGKGYGLFNFNKIPQKAHRISFLHFGGVLTDEKPFVLHKPIICHTRSCVNPSHLYAGNRKNNEKDKILDKTKQFGDGCYNSILNENDVLEIREKYRIGNQTELAKIYGVSRSNISAIIVRKSWKHI